MNIIEYKNIEEKIIELRGLKVILDSDVADIYDVKTRDINKAVKNNPAKFPQGYIVVITKKEFENLRWKFSTAKFTKTRVLPKTFSEKGLYMLATILKSPIAVQSTIAIIETFSRIRELSGTIKELSKSKGKKIKNELMQKSGEIIAEILDDSLETTGTETSIEINFAVLKFKHTLKRSKESGKNDK